MPVLKRECHLAYAREATTSTCVFAYNMLGLGLEMGVVTRSAGHPGKNMLQQDSINFTPFEALQNHSS